MNNYLLGVLAAFLSFVAVASPAKPAMPFVNPAYAASTYAETHMLANFTPLAGPVGPGRPLQASEVTWKPIGPVNGWALMYSGPYPDGRRVIWVGGYDRVAKLDADTLEVLTTYAIGGNTYFGQEEIERHIATIDQLGDRDFVNYNINVWAEPIRSIVSVYRFLSSDNELYLFYRMPNGKVILQVYGEADSADPASAIQLRREWSIPAQLSAAPVMGVKMTADGWVIVATQDGTLFALSKDFTEQYSVKLPSQREEGPNQNFLSAFMRNSVAIDDQGGIYVVTRDNMHRVQWTGSGFSLDEADGAWSAPYPNELGVGSGTTPGLMGWGAQEDHLVVIADGTRGNNMVAFWRDNIPDDWQGLPGHDRRIAGITPIRFGVSPTEQVQVENTPVVYGYGAFFNNIFPENRSKDQTNPMKQWFTEALSMHVPGQGTLGGAMIQWDPQQRVLNQAWNTQLNFVSTVCMISGATDILYCWGNRNREWTLEGIDWRSGKSAFHYTLGKSHRYNPMGGLVTVAPNGAVDCACPGGFGMVRVQPEGNSTGNRQ